ncbi:MAG: adaptor protein MecA [Clostridia bacterium]|nr:adaptor protein MecA [Clostridia bacterium]
MQIQKEAPDSLRVELTAEELQSFGLTYQLLHYQDAKSKELLTTVLKNAAALTEFSHQNCRLLIEVFPAPLQGCTLYFTRLEQKTKRYQALPPHVYRFADAEHMFMAIEQLNKSIKSELYSLQDRYILVLHHPPKHSLLEYGEQLVAGKTSLAYIREHGKLLSAPFAVSAVLRALNPP